MKVLNVEEVSPTKRKLSFQIDPEDLQTEKDEAYEELGKAAEIPGFRKGHVPRRFLEYRFDKDIQKEAFGDALQKALETASEEKSFRPVGRPDFDEDEFEAAAEKSEKEAVELSMTVEVIPEIDLPDYKGIKVEVEEVASDEDAVERMLERMRERQANYRTVDDRASEKGDYLMVDMTATRGEEAFEPLSQSQLTIPDLCGAQTTPGLDEGLVGKQKGESFDFSFDFDKENPFFEEDGTNAVHVKGKVRQISERLVPDLDDDFAKDNGFENLDQVREGLKKQFDDYEESILARRKRERVIEKLVEDTELPIPTSLIQREYMSLKYLRQRQAQEQGTDEMYLSAEEKSTLEMNTMHQAEQQVKRELILGKIAEVEKLEITDDDYYQQMAARAYSEGQTNVDKYLAEIDKQGLEETYRENLLMDKAGDWLVENNEFEVVKADAK